jgi:hypothetical protein
MVIGPYKVIAPLNPPLKFYFACNSGLPAERVGFLFCLDFFWLLFCIKTKK